MMTVDITAKLMAVIDEERKFVDRESGKVQEYQKRVCRVLVGDEFVILQARDGVQMPAPEAKGKSITAKLVAFSNEKDVVRATTIEIKVA